MMSSRLMIILLVVACIGHRAAAQSCAVEGCSKCKDGMTNACATCMSDGYEEEFVRDGNGQVRVTCKKVNSTNMILAIVLSICGTLCAWLSYYCSTGCAKYD